MESAPAGVAEMNDTIWVGMPVGDTPKALAFARRFVNRITRVPAPGGTSGTETHLREFELARTAFVIEPPGALGLSTSISASVPSPVNTRDVTFVFRKSVQVTDKGVAGLPP